MKNILVVGAHPDDESLGLGGTLALHSQNGDNISLIIFATGQYQRDENEKGILKRRKQCEKASRILGINNIEFYNYDDQKLESVPLTELIRHIEVAIKKFKIDVVYTHFWGDMNQDHRRIYEATLIATRPKRGNKVNTIICYETPSSTDNTFGTNIFSPNYFVNIKKVVKTKEKAVSQYKNEIPKFPHPRSIEALKSRAKYWGSKINVEYAEAFVKIREIEFV
jgi:LmbE family N-acetylglucosaminyl deacetylase